MCTAQLLPTPKALFFASNVVQQAFSPYEVKIVSYSSVHHFKHSSKNLSISVAVEAPLSLYLRPVHF